MNRTTRIMQMHLRDKWSWFLIPSMIVGISFSINLLISLFMTEPLYTGGIASVFVYIFVIGILVVPQTFPLAIGLGTTRGDYYRGTALTGLAFGAMTAIVLLALGWLERLTDAWGTDFHFFALPYVAEGNALAVVAQYFLIYMFLFFWGMFIASTFRRFGVKSLLYSLLIAIVVGTVAGFLALRFAWWEAIFEWFATHSLLVVSLWTLPLTLVLAIAAYGMLRKSVV
ncbi:hypothetical protein IDH44_17645 [Paenibacillus sp. IB182496]|uniref:Uncharacterized protein n=1 Tax=Paenibacillus sabuli TaxID=2772509 RepID=A0A927BWH7_9BACL|nr:hypothetical protein [Paenibacillus sabuli]MBD2847025.1 hypothetical protein [Paenibacillus sabuli]